MNITEVTYEDRVDRCTSVTTGITAQARKRSGKTANCINFASYMVDGKAMCSTHAKTAALQYLINKPN